MTNSGCMAHARRKLRDLHANHRSEIAQEGLRYFAALYEIEREARELKLDAKARHQLRQQRSKPIAEALRQWLTRQRGQVPDGSATAKAIEYSLGRWAALTRYLDDADLPIDNNHVENRIRPVALGRSNWLFAGSLRAGQRAAVVMSLIQSAKLNGHDPYRYLASSAYRPTPLVESKISCLTPGVQLFHQKPREPIRNSRSGRDRRRTWYCWWHPAKHASSTTTNCSSGSIGSRSRRRDLPRA